MKQQEALRNAPGLVSSDTRGDRRRRAWIEHGGVSLIVSFGLCLGSIGPA